MSKVALNIQNSHCTRKVVRGGRHHSRPMGEGQQPTDTPDNGAVDGSTPSDGARKGENGGVSSTERTGDGDVHTSTPGYDDEDEEDDMDARGGRAHKKSSEVRRECPYLDTVNRQVCCFSFNPIVSSFLL